MLVAGMHSCAVAMGGLVHAPATRAFPVMSSVTDAAAPYANKLAEMTEQEQADELQGLLSSSAFLATLSPDELSMLQSELERRQSLLAPSVSGNAAETDECVEVPAEAYWCNENGCWIGAVQDPETALEPEPVLDIPPVTLPDGRVFSMYQGVESHASVMSRPAGFSKRKPAPVGPFAPVVLASKAVVGEKEINKIRGKVIQEHSKVIGAFVDTSESEFGQLVLKQMFEAADKDGNGTLDREEIRAALNALGFTFIKDKQLDTMMNRADENGDMVIDFEEFVTHTPKNLRTNLVQLAKKNGHDLGFMA